MQLILAIDSDPRRSEQLANLVRSRLQVDLVQATSAGEALHALRDRVPDLILTSPLLSPFDDGVLDEYLRDLGAAATHVQTVRIPMLSTGPRKKSAAGRLFSLGRKQKQTSSAAPDGCDPKIFADEIAHYLTRSLEERSASSKSAADRMPQRQPEPVLLDYARREQAVDEWGAPATLVEEFRAPIERPQSRQPVKVAPIVEETHVPGSILDLRPASPKPRNEGRAPVVHAPVRSAAAEPIVVEPEPETYVNTEPPTYVMPEPAYVSAEPTYVRPEPTYVQPESTYVVPEPTYVKPEPTYVKPEPTYVKPEPAYVMPEPTYVRPEPSYIQPEPTYVTPQPAARVEPEPVRPAPAAVVTPAVSAPAPAAAAATSGNSASFEAALAAIRAAWAKPEATASKPEATASKPQATASMPAPKQTSPATLPGNARPGGSGEVDLTNDIDALDDAEDSPDGSTTPNARPTIEKPKKRQEKPRARQLRADGRDDWGAFDPDTVTNVR